MKSIILLIITLNSLFALVSITPVEIGDKAGFNANLSASLETKRGNTDKDNYASALRLSYDNNASFVTWTEVSGEYGESNDVKDTDKLYAHIRHIHAITSEALRGELFAQAQNDEFRLIKSRIVGGGGLRFKLFDMFDDAHGYLGLGALYEKIIYTSIDPIENNTRANTYFAYTLGFGNGASATYMFYYQPLLKNFEDFVQTHEFELKLPIYKKLSLNINISYDIDSVPPLGVEEKNFSQRTSFSFEF